MRPLAVVRLSVRNVRNLRHVDVEPGARLNVFSGDNGQGKTNLVEAIYLGATTKSFRTSKLKELLTEGEREGSVRLSVAGDPPYEQSVGIRAGGRVLRVDGAAPPSAVAYASRTPVVVFSPTEVALSMGSSRERRRLLDQIALYTTPARAEASSRMAHALSSRQRVLETRGTGAADLDAWEDLIVRHGLETMATRRAASELLARAATVAFSEIAAPDLDLGVRYAPGAPEDEAQFRGELQANRERDLRRGSATSGPHRDELELTISGHTARGWASQGQHRAIVLALKAAELAVVADARLCRPVLLLDDVSSELDRERSAALLAFLVKLEGQVFVTTTRPEWIDTPTTERKDFAVQGGQIRTL